jgi:glutamate racemase
LPAPIGAFDSGLGGLTVIRTLRERLPAERIVYVGDTAHVPYGGRPAEEIQRFSLDIARYLIESHGAKAIVVPCNTATSAAVPLLRETFPNVPIVGTEPGVKPAARATETGVVGVLATVGTLNGNRMAQLVSTFAEGVTVLKQPCPRWVELVEEGKFDTPETLDAVRECVEPLLSRGADVLVLGCTHFPALTPVIRQVAGEGVVIIDTTEAVVRRVADVVCPAPPGSVGGLILYATGAQIEQFASGARHLLGSGSVAPPVEALRLGNSAD